MVGDGLEPSTAEAFYLYRCTTHAYNRPTNCKRSSQTVCIKICCHIITMTAIVGFYCVPLNHLILKLPIRSAMSMLISSSLLLLIDVAIIFSMYFFCWNDSSLMLLSRNEMNSSGSTDILICPFIALCLKVSVCVSTLCYRQVSFPDIQDHCGISHVATCRSSSFQTKVCWRVATSDIPHDTRDALPSILVDIPLLP